MTNRMKKCPKCHRYTINPTKCPVCNSPLENVHPPKFSLQDKYQQYRMKFFHDKMLKKYPDLEETPEPSAVPETV